MDNEKFEITQEEYDEILEKYKSKILQVTTDITQQNKNALTIFQKTTYKIFLLFL